MKKTADTLLEHGIRPSIQRVLIYEHLKSVDSHPTVDAVFSALRRKLPTISRMTIYNTLKIFLEKNLIIQVPLGTIDAHYDACLKSHAHFQCRICGKIFDIPLEKNFAFPTPKGFVVDELQGVAFGRCPKCTVTR